jgi:hypothetical protein
MVIKSKSSKTNKKVSNKQTKTPSKLSLLKNKKVLATSALALILSAGVASGYKIYKKTERNKVVKEYSQNLRKIIYNKNKFLACDKSIAALGNKSNLDILPFEMIDNILKNFNKMTDLNNQCLVNERIKEYCCKNRERIFIDIFKNIGYIKGINKANGEYLFTFLVSKNAGKIKIDKFYINEINPFDIDILLIFIIVSFNNKLKVDDINNTKNTNIWGVYPYIYYYSCNNNIRKYILDEYNKLNDINNFYPINNTMTNYIRNNINTKLHQLTHTDIENYSKLQINGFKHEFPQIIQLMPN